MRESERAKCMKSYLPMHQARPGSDAQRKQLLPGWLVLAEQGRRPEAQQGVGEVAFKGEESAEPLRKKKGMSMNTSLFTGMAVFCRRWLAENLCCQSIRCCVNCVGVVVTGHQCCSISVRRSDTVPIMFRKLLPRRRLPHPWERYLKYYRQYKPDRQAGRRCVLENQGTWHGFSQVRDSLPAPGARRTPQSGGAFGREQCWYSWESRAGDRDAAGALGRRLSRRGHPNFQYPQYRRGQPIVRFSATTAARTQA